ncbi:hypothetical protein Tco_0180272 [Tanacetum coccineum]
MVDSKPMEEEFQGATTRDVGTKTHGEPTKPVLQTQKTCSPSPAFIKKNIDVLRTMIKEHDQQAKMKATPRKLAYADSDKEALASSLANGFSDRFSLESSGTSDTYRQTRSANKSKKAPSKNKESTHLRWSRRLEDQSITKEKVRKERSKSRRKRSGHQEASSNSEYEEGSEDSYEDLNSLVYEGNKDPEDHLGIFSAAPEQEEWPMLVWCKMFCQTLGGARRQNEGLQAFMDRFKSESSHIKGVPSVLRIVAFMHGPGIRKSGEAAVGSAEMVHPPQEDKGYDTFTPLIKTLKEILAIESVSFLEPPPLIGTPEKQNLNKLCDYHGDRGHNTNNCYQLKKQIEEAVSSGKLAHLVKDIRWNNQQNRNQGRNGVKIINMIREEGNRKRPFEEGRSGLMNELTFPTIPHSQLTNEPIILEGIVEGSRVRRILVDGGSSSEIMYEHCFRNLDINTRSRLRRCKIPMMGFSGETYHPLGIISLRVTMGKNGRRLWEEVQWRQREEKMSKIREKAILRARSNYERRPVYDDGSHVDNQLQAATGRHSMGKHGVVHKRRPVAPEGRLALKEKVFRWLGEGLIRKEYSQIRMEEDDKEKTRFYTKEGVYCFTHMPKELKNSTATLQRMMEKVLADQRGRNVEIHFEDIVIKSKSEQNLIRDVKETLRKLRRVNIKIDLIMSSFGVKEGKFLGHMVKEEGLRADPERIQEIILSPTRRSKETIEEVSGVGIILGLATIKLEFLNQEVSVGIKTRPSVEETSSNKKGKAASNAPRAEL